MDCIKILTTPHEFALAIDVEISALPVCNTPNQRAVLYKYLRRLKDADPVFVLDAARALLKEHRWLAYELIASHRGAFERIREKELEEFGQGINSWGSVDCFARTLAEPAWLRGQVSIDLMLRWAHSPDHWWRRAALVSTVALNVRTHGGQGDVKNTLAICEILVDDHNDLVVKALSWALRELVVHDQAAVQNFITAHEVSLAARVKREVRNKLETGLKNP